VTKSLPVVVIGAGPVGLAAAAHLAERGLPFVVLEAGDGPGAAIAQWGHVRLFSPWRYNTDHAAVRLLEKSGWTAPNPEFLPTGADLIDGYLRPLAQHPALAPHIRYGVKVEAVTRQGYDRVRTAGRDETPFLVRLSIGEEVTAQAVIDASGTWTTPNVLGASGIPAIGETQAAQAIVHALPDVLGADRARFAGRHNVVVGAGHSAATTLLALAELAQDHPDTKVTWAIRAGNASRTYGGGEADALPARGALGSKVHQYVLSGQIGLATGFFTHSVEAANGRVRLISRDPRGVEQILDTDVVVNATGFRPDHTITGELRLDLDPILGSTRTLAPLIDPNHHSCGTVPPHGVDELSHPEPGFYAIGVKSYGRAPTFLLATGYEQARSVVAALAGDWEAARDVRLELPETGVCSSNLSNNDQAVESACCGAPAQESLAMAGAGRGLATGVSGGLISLPLVEAKASGSSCCS
jgi:thioredoxin reductase